MLAKTDSRSSGFTHLKVEPDSPRLDEAASKPSLKGAANLELELTSNATRDKPGTSSFRSSSRLPTRSLAELENPVTLASGRARLFTKLLPSGSGTMAKITGIVDVAALA